MYGNYHNLHDSLGRNRCRKVRAQESLLGDTFTRRQYNDRVLGEEGQENEPRRPRVVDKRVSARGSDAAQTPEPPPQQAPPPRSEDPVDAPSPPPHAPPTPSRGDAPPGGAREVWTPEQEAEMQRLTQEIAQRPSLEWVVNTALTLVNVAGTKLELGQAPDAQLAIDALAGMLQSAGSRLGSAEQPLRQALAELQLAFAQKAAPPPDQP